ncbi:hypothetical protein ACSQ67_024768 [Phaseolus vulgaris]
MLFSVGSERFSHVAVSYYGANMHKGLEQGFLINQPEYRVLLVGRGYVLLKRCEGPSIERLGGWCVFKATGKLKRTCFEGMGLLHTTR